jgi:hypothetical protein
MPLLADDEAVNLASWPIAIYLAGYYRRRLLTD